MKLYIDTENKIIHCYDVTIPAMDQIKKMIEAVGGDPKDYRIEQQYNYQPYVQPYVQPATWPFEPVIYQPQAQTQLPDISSYFYGVMPNITIPDTNPYHSS